MTEESLILESSPIEKIKKHRKLYYKSPHYSKNIAVPGNITHSFFAPNDYAEVKFKLSGNKSIDGAGNGWTDTFSFSSNGEILFRGSFDLGGGGEKESIASSSFDLEYKRLNENTIEFTIPILLIHGVNKISFNYEGTYQSKDDESWSISEFNVISREWKNA